MSVFLTRRDLENELEELLTQIREAVSFLQSLGVNVRKINIYPELRFLPELYAISRVLKWFVENPQIIFHSSAFPELSIGTDTQSSSCGLIWQKPPVVYCISYTFYPDKLQVSGLGNIEQVLEFILAVQNPSDFVRDFIPRVLKTANVEEGSEVWNKVMNFVMKEPYKWDLSGAEGIYYLGQGKVKERKFEHSVLDEARRISSRLKYRFKINITPSSIRNLFVQWLNERIGLENILKLVRGEFAKVASPLFEDVEKRYFMYLPYLGRL